MPSRRARSGARGRHYRAIVLASGGQQFSHVRRARGDGFFEQYMIARASSGSDVGTCSASMVPLMIASAVGLLMRVPRRSRSTSPARNPESRPLLPCATLSDRPRRDLELSDAEAHISRSTGPCDPRDYDCGDWLRHWLLHFEHLIKLVLPARRRDAGDHEDRVAALDELVVNGGSTALRIRPSVSFAISTKIGCTPQLSARRRRSHRWTRRR